MNIIGLCVCVCVCLFIIIIIIINNYFILFWFTLHSIKIHENVWKTWIFRVEIDAHSGMESSLNVGEDDHFGI
jgi:hypothetical protein